jgi:hypothetical protein
MLSWVLSLNVERHLHLVPFALAPYNDDCEAEDVDVLHRHGERREGGREREVAGGGAVWVG